MMHANDGQATPRTQQITTESVSIAASESLKHLTVAELFLERVGYTEDAKELLNEVRKELEALHSTANKELEGGAA